MISRRGWLRTWTCWGRNSGRVWRLSGVGSKPFCAFREGNLGSYDPLSRPWGGTRLPVAFTEGAFREQNLELSLARPAAMLVAGWDLPIANAARG